MSALSGFDFEGSPSYLFKKENFPANFFKGKNTFFKNDTGQEISNILKHHIQASRQLFLLNLWDGQMDDFGSKDLLRHIQASWVVS